MGRPPKKYVCEKCGYLGDTAEHEGCDYLAWATGEQLYIDHLEAELAALRASPASVPEGFALVPVEPTPEMLTAGEQESENELATYETVFAAMLAAVPTLAAWPDGTPRAFDNYEHDKRFAADSPTTPVSEDRKDAERYLWLRASDFDIFGSPHAIHLSGKELDQAIDAAMKEDKT